MREQFRVFRRLPPREQRQVRQSFERYRDFSPERRLLLRRAFGDLLRLSPAERERFLSRLDRWRELTPEQRERLRLRVRERIGERTRDRR